MVAQAQARLAAASHLEAINGKLDLLHRLLFDLVAPGQICCTPGLPLT